MIFYIGDLLPLLCKLSSCVVVHAVALIDGQWVVLKSSPLKVFKVDARTGKMTLKEKLDYENVKSYSFLVIAEVSVCLQLLDSTWAAFNYSIFMDLHTWLP